MKPVLALALAATLAACAHSSGTPIIADTAQTRAAIGAQVAEAAARDCPFPATVDHYEQTTLAPRGATTPPARLGVFDTVKQGCAILTFTVDENGQITGADLVSANPPAFGAIAPKILRWSNYASGASTLTEFMVRLGAQTLPNGGAMISLGFRDSVVNLDIPPR